MGSACSSLPCTGIYESELDNIYHTADVNRDGYLNVKEVLLGAAIVYERYNQKLAPEVGHACATVVEVAISFYCWLCTASLIGNVGTKVANVTSSFP